MAIKRRKNKLQDLAASGIVTNRISGSIPFEYEGPNSPLFTISEIPPSVPQGKSSFLIAGTELLKNSIEVKIEIIDSEGGVIYTEPVANYLEGNARRVSIEVYDDTPPGPANLYVLAQVDPEEWEDETGTDVTNYPSARPLRPKGKKRKKRRQQREKRKQQRGQPVFDMFKRGGAGAFFVNPNFRPPPGNDTRFRRRRSRRRRRTTDISDQYNFIQKIQMQIVPTATNTEKILFYQEPRLRVFEAFKPSVSNIAPSASLTETGFGITGTVIQDTAGSAAASSLDTFGAAINTFRKKRKFRKFAMKGGLSKRKRITRRASPEVDNYSLNVGTNFNFTSEHVGADLKLTNISVDQNQFPSSRFKADSLGTELNKATASFEVRKVKNSFTIIPDKPFQLFDSQISQVVDAPLTNASFSIEFPNPVTQSISITNFRSYADVRVSNIRTFSGDVFRAKVYRKSEESISDYELFADLPLESSELLLNKNEGTGLERTGYFVTQSDAVDYWEVSSSHTGLTGTAATASAKYDIDKIMDAIHISGSNYEKNNFVHFRLKKEYSFILEKDVDYDFSAQIYGIAKPKIVQPEEGPAVTKSIAEMEVFISGSNIPAQQGNEPFGAKIGALRIIDGSVEKDFGIVTGDFESSDTSANCVISFKVNAGQFYLSDLSLRPATETGFSPDLFTFQAPMPDNETRPETYEFLAEFYDVNNNQADAFAFTPSGSVFQGSNMVIGGGDNVMESNLFIGGETTASGMHLGGVKSTVPEQGGVAGAEGSAFMRSVGYTGFTSASVAGKGGKPGFMFYSGSILPSSGDNYKGVGLELVGESGSLRFGTNPSRFEVKADAFFVGRRHEDSSTGIGQFISGALGNVEISSSNFHLTRAGNVTMAGTITATAGAIGGFGISANSISSSNNNLILRSTGEITGSEVLFTGGKIASFEISDSVLKNDKNFFISGAATGNQFFISSSNFNVKASGDITGSQVLFEGGKIGGLTIAGDNLSAGNSYKISSSQDVNDDVSFISSSEFKVSADGRITGSQVKFDGGTIAGWNINSDNLQGGSLILSKDGSMRSSNYVSDFSGWIISAEDNGFAEFENVKVRGTLATTTFEKETVNAVGGQLFVANSTTITGSAVGASATTMSVENMSGFAEGEVLIAKKVTNTGFTTEYIKVNSASFDGDVSKDEFFGRIMVDRGIGQSPPPGTDSGSVGDPPGAGVGYEPGQVLASTGKIGTGYIRINANPNNSATPYIDIVERTGSGPYDVELKARLGDLSGTAGTRNVPLGFTGFGLMSEVAFLSGSQIKLEAPAFILGDQNKTFVSGSEGNIEISSSAFHLKRDGQLLFGDKAGGKYVEWDNSNLIVRGDIAVDSITTPSTIEGSPSNHTNASASITATGEVAFRNEYFLGKADSTFISGSLGNLEISSSRFALSRAGDLGIGQGTIENARFGTQELYDLYTTNANHTSNLAFHMHLTSSTYTPGAAARDLEQGDSLFAGSALGYTSVFTGGSSITAQVFQASIYNQSEMKVKEGAVARAVEFGRGIEVYPLAAVGLYVDVGLTTTSENTISYSFWMYSYSPNQGLEYNNPDRQMLIGYGSSDNGINVSLGGGFLHAFAWDGSAGSGDQTGLQSTVQVEANKWYHVVLLFNSNNSVSGGVAANSMQFYVNNVAAGTQALDADTAGGIFNFSLNELCIGSHIGIHRFGVSGTGSTNAKTEVTLNSGQPKFQFHGMLCDVRMYSDCLTTTEIQNLYNGRRQPLKTGNVISYTNSTQDIALNANKFMLGASDPLTPTFVSASEGNLEIKSENFHLTPAGDVSASNLHLGGVSFVKNVSVADYFAFRNVVITARNYRKYMREFTATNNSSTRTFWQLVLDGSLGGQQGMLVTLDNLGDGYTSGYDSISDVYPIASIVPPTQFNNPSILDGEPPLSGSGAGHRIIIESDNDVAYFTRNNGAASNIDASSDVPQGYHIESDVDDMYSFGFSRTYTIDDSGGGANGPYSNTLKIGSGTRVEFVRGAKDWKIQNISSLTGIGLASPGPTATFNTSNTYLAADGRSVAPFIIAGTPFLGAEGQGLGTLFLTSNKVVHADTSLYYGSSTRSGDNQDVNGSTNATCSLGMQTGGGNVFHLAAIQWQSTYQLDVAGTYTDTMAIGAAGGTDSNSNPNWPDTEFPLHTRPNNIGTMGNFLHNYSQDHTTLYDVQIQGSRVPRIRSNAQAAGGNPGQYTIHVDADVDGVSVNRRYSNSYLGRSFEVFHSSSDDSTEMTNIGLLDGDYVARFVHDGNHDGAHGISIQAGHDSNTGATTYVAFRDGNGTAIGSISANGGTITYGTFTGIHEAYAVDSNGVIECEAKSVSSSIWPIGTVCSYVSSSLNYDKHGNVNSQPVNYIASSSAYQDKKVYGVYFSGLNDEPTGSSAHYTPLYRPLEIESVEPETKYGSMQQLEADYYNTSSGEWSIPDGYVKKNSFDHFSDMSDYLYVSQSWHSEVAYENRQENLHSIAALGDAIIRVNNQGGNIEIGDYLTSSNTGGVACKQDDDLLHNYTIAKSTQNVNFSEITGSEVTIACTLHAG